MPSLRDGLHSADCPLEEYELPHDDEVSGRVFAASARAVSYHAGIMGVEEGPVDQKLQLVAQQCAARIVAGECPQWALDSTKGGFVLKPSWLCKISLASYFG